MPPRPNEQLRANASVAERVHAILRSKGLTLYRVSQHSSALYGRSSPNFVPHNLYYDLRSEKSSPSIHQIFTLSRLSGYRLQDWLRVFGLDCEDISRLQLRLPGKRTILLDTSLKDEDGWIPWVRNRQSLEMIPAIAPVAQLLELTPPRRRSSIPQPTRHFLYAKIGYEDAMAFPEFVPGSIVRIRPDVDGEVSRSKPSTISDHFFLIEHSKGFSCCRIRSLTNGVIVPVDNGLSFAQMELHIPQEARVWGYVDLEFRPLLGVEEPHIPKDLGRRWKPQSLRSEQSFGQLLRDARRRLQLSTREAAGLSRRMAEIQRDDRYRISSSSMSDYELRNAPPRDLHRIFTLCSIYGLQLASLMKALGIDLEDSGRERIPDRYLSRNAPSFPAKAFREDVPGGVLERLLDACENEVPFFLWDLPEYFSGARSLSLEDFFWVGGNDAPLHPYLADGLIAIVNRRRKTPIHFLSRAIWQQPIYIFLIREGKYRAACCGIENDKLIVHPQGQDLHRGAEYRYHKDAEVIGQIVAIARRIP